MQKKKDKIKLCTKDKIALSMYMLLSNNRYNEITVSSLCKRAGISRMSFYRYFSNKDDIFVDFCDTRFEEFFEIIKNMDLSIETLVFEIFNYIKKFRHQIDKLKKAGLQYLLLKQFDSYIKYVANNVKNQSLKDSLKNKIFSPFIAGGIFMAMMTWSDNDYLDSPNEITKLTLEVLNIKNNH